MISVSAPRQVPETGTISVKVTKKKHLLFNRKILLRTPTTIITINYKLKSKLAGTRAPKHTFTTTRTYFRTIKVQRYHGIVHPREKMGRKPKVFGSKTATKVRVPRGWKKHKTNAQRKMAPRPPRIRSITERLTASLLFADHDGRGHPAQKNYTSMVCWRFWFNVISFKGCEGAFSGV